MSERALIVHAAGAYGLARLINDRLATAGVIASTVDTSLSEVDAEEYERLERQAQRRANPNHKGAKEKARRLRQMANQGTKP